MNNTQYLGGCKHVLWWMLTHSTLVVVVDLDVGNFASTTLRDTVSHDDHMTIIC